MNVRCEYCSTEAAWGAETVNGLRHMCQSHYTTYTRDLRGMEGARLSGPIADLIRELRTLGGY